MSWTFALPTQVTFGEGAASELAQHVAAVGARALLVTDAVLLEQPCLVSIRQALPWAGVFADVQPNPTVANVDALAAAVVAADADVLVAVGGGSVMDCTKAAAALVCNEGESIRAYHSEGGTLSGARLPMIAVPTTAGTGSEVTPFSVLNDDLKGIKGPMAHPSLYPARAVVDPSLSASMPSKVTACTGLDALSHALEGYWSKNHQPLCDMMAMEAGRRIFASLPKVLANPVDLAARSDMAYAALLAGMAFQLPKNAMVHACSFPLSSRYHMPHGAACAFTLEFAVRFNAPAMAGRMEQFAAACGFPTVSAMADAIGALKRQGGLPCTLVDAGIPSEALPQLVAESFHPLMKNNPRDVTADDLERMYEELA
jgi:alcohol dehydrogenase